MSTIIFNVGLHDAQKEIHDSPARFKIIAAGRRFGKTRYAVSECLSVGSKGGIAWWVAPNYKVARVGWRPIARLGRKLGGKVNKSDRTVTFPNGGEVVVRSGEDPQSLRGEGIDLVVLDEFAYMREAVWTEAVRPSLSTPGRPGRAIFISTPAGRNHFWRMYNLAAEDDTGEWASFSFPTTANPYIDPAEVEKAKRDLPIRIFRQEYEADFIDDGSGVFRNVLERAVSKFLEGPIEGRTYVAGVDVASDVDFTVITVMDRYSAEVVYIDRFNKIDYPLLEKRLESVIKKFGVVDCVIEDNSIGRPVIDHLVEKNLPVRGFTTTNVSKSAYITELVSAFEHDEISIPNDQGLILELQAYEGKRLASGRFQYSAPAGLHDDRVISLALCYSAAGTGPLILFGA